MLEDEHAPPVEPTGEPDPDDAGVPLDRPQTDVEEAKKKQAVLLVHGIGEQLPMETLRGFVETMWVRDETLGQGAANPVWFKPDRRNDSAELWRITTEKAALQPPPDGAAKPRGTGQRVDFYEFYWADLTASNTLDQLNDWFWFLLLRKPEDVPPRVLVVWRVLWASALVVAVFLGWQALAAGGFVRPLPGPATAAIAIATLLYGLAIKIVIAYVGDVARYCRAKPANIAARREVRARGLARLKAIAESGEYDRVVLVGHSLGSIIAYDILKLLWAEWAEATPVGPKAPLYGALIACRQKAHLLDDGANAPPTALADFRAAQSDVFSAAQSDPRPAAKEEPKPTFKPWVVSDFVSVGAALSHAQFLLAHDAAEFDQGKSERRFPSIPPIADGELSPPEGDAATTWDPKLKHYMYLNRRTGGIGIDFAAVFAAVRWTNLHDDAIAILGGDIVSGPCAGIFGKGILDKSVTIRRETGIGKQLPRLFTHTLYWSDTRADPDRGGLPVQIIALRQALNLARVSPPPI